MNNINRRDRVKVAESRALVKEYPLFKDKTLPLVIECQERGLDLKQWIVDNSENLGKKLVISGAILFRGFEVNSINAFEDVVKSFKRDLINYDFASTPRSILKGKIYTSTEYPADQVITQHNEMAYSNKWPKKLCFFCLIPSETGGETPLADSREIYARIDGEVRDKFESSQLLYVRNYQKNLDLPWQKVFQTESKEDVEQYCKENSIGYKWLSDDHLQTSERCPSVISHPATQEKCWFNQAHLFHITNLDDRIYETMQSDFDEDTLPRNVYFGNKEAIPAAWLTMIRGVYERSKISFAWKKNDILLVDNILVSHGRNSFTGERKVVVAMTN